MRNFTKTGLRLALLSALSATIAFADPSFTTFGSFPTANFGGTGIPTSAVAITTSGDLTLALTAHQRYFNPALTNDGAGTFFAQAGENDGLAGKSVAAKWNFAYYISNTTTAASDPYTYTLYYGLEGGTEYSLNPLGIGDNDPTAGFGGQNSQSLSFFAYGNLSAFQFNPFFGTFDPDANGNYEFDLVARTATGAEAARVGIVVNVSGGTSVPDSATTGLLLGVALLGLAGFRRLKR